MVFNKTDIKKRWSKGSEYLGNMVFTPYYCLLFYFVDFKDVRNKAVCSTRSAKLLKFTLAIRLLKCHRNKNLLPSLPEHWSRKNIKSWFCNLFAQARKFVQFLIYQLGLGYVSRVKLCYFLNRHISNEYKRHLVNVNH